MTIVKVPGSVSAALQTELYLRQRDDDKERSIEFLDFNQVSKQGNGLNGFSKSHFISKDAIKSIIVQRNQPFKTSHLKPKHST